ncbi:arylesterase [Anaerolineales bacterium HSG25]|nr:arylesterase [Anaerolineales bacterium HSG25]
MITILALGDSLTAGFAVATKQSYPVLLEQKLRMAGYDCHVINAGISGETSAGTLSRINSRLIPKPNIIVLETGLNDYFQGINPLVTAQNIRQIVRICKTQDVAVILAGMHPVGMLNKNSTAFAQLYPTIAKEEGVILIPFFLKGVVNQPNHSPSLTQPDGVHPTAAGYEVVMETVYPYLVKAIGI